MSEMAAIKNISLFVPHVFPNFTKEYVATIFEKIIGPVEQVDFVLKQDRSGKEFNSVYIHFKFWNNTEENKNFQNLLSSQQQARIYHDNPWYWIVLPNNTKKHISGDRKVKIDLGDEKAINVNSLKTPEKPKLKRSENIRDCPNAPIKSYADVVKIPFPDLISIEPGVKFNLLEDMEKEDEDEDQIAMDEIEAELEKEDANLTTVDRRYIQVIENENIWLREEVAQLRAALINLDYLYQAEAAKVRALNISFENTDVK